MLSRMKPATGPGAEANPITKQKEKRKEVPKLHDFLDNRDYTGAITLLEVLTENVSFYFLSILLGYSVCLFLV